MAAFIRSTACPGAWMILLSAMAATNSMTAMSATVGWSAMGPLRSGQVIEWRLDGIPTASNVFDPAVIAVDVEFLEPGGTRRNVPAFWYQDYEHELRNGEEVLTRQGEGEWRVRYFANGAGAHEAQVKISTNAGPSLAHGTTTFEVLAATNAPGRGFIRVAADGQFFETTDGQPLPLVGADVCWPGRRGTYDYETWFPAMAGSGWNWARLWMAPWAFGIETVASERLQYRLDRAWQLDRVFELARQRGIVLLLCLDYHGMFEVEPDFWGGNNYWPRHPYNAASGGPCASQRDFFTKPAAHALYQKRLRYLVARYGADPSLFAWEFFNEIDNVYRYLDANEVAQWHATMGAWLKANDPWKHLISTSLTGNSDRAELWSLPILDFAMYHSYSQPSPSVQLAEVIQSMRSRYSKPVLIAEAGVDWRGWARESDPHLRGFRQLLWGGLIGGSAGTSMSWWWESIHAENAYPLYRALTNIVSRTGWGRGRWDPVRFRMNDPQPVRVGEPVEGGEPFNATLILDGTWGARTSGALAVAAPLSAGDATKRLNAFVHGTAHAELRTPFQLDAWFADSARLVMHLNSVSGGAILAVRVDGAEVFRRALPNKDGGFAVNNEYNEDIAVPLPPGHHLVEIRNAGADWFYLDHVKLEGVRPSEYLGGWKPAPAVTGIRHEGELLMYLVAPGVEYPAQALVTNLPVHEGIRLAVSNLPAGDYAALWFNTRDGAEAGRSAGRVGAEGLLQIEVPPFTEDLVGHVFTPPRLRAQGFTEPGHFSVLLEGARAQAFTMERSMDLKAWTHAGPVDGLDESTPRWTDALPPETERAFYRLRFIEE